MKRCACPYCDYPNAIKSTKELSDCVKSEYVCTDCGKRYITVAPLNEEQYVIAEEQSRRNPERLKRNLWILDLRRAGKKYRQISAMTGLTRSRVQAIVKHYENKETL